MVLTRTYAHGHTRTHKLTHARARTRRAESLGLREAVGRARQGHVLLTSERTCCLCYKRIGPAVFVAHPDHSLAHYLCHTRREKQQQQQRAG